jgi:hypothetical protein
MFYIRTDVGRGLMMSRPEDGQDVMYTGQSTTGWWGGGGLSTDPALGEILRLPSREIKRIGR